MSESVTERREQIAATLSRLPPQSYEQIDSKIYLIMRGQSGRAYMPELTALNATADELNAREGVTPELAACMTIGAAFGWNAPGADPGFWEGLNLKPKMRRRWGAAGER